MRRNLSLFGNNTCNLKSALLSYLRTPGKRPLAISLAGQRGYSYNSGTELTWSAPEFTLDTQSFLQSGLTSNCSKQARIAMPPSR